MTRPKKSPRRKRELKPGIFRSRGGRLNRWPNEAETYDKTYHGIVADQIHEVSGDVTAVLIEPQRALVLVPAVQQEAVWVLLPQLLHRRLQTGVAVNQIMMKMAIRRMKGKHNNYDDYDDGDDCGS